MNRIFLDLEMNPVSSQYRYLKKLCRQEIVQIAAVMYDDSGRQVGSFCEFVRPQYNDRITPEIHRLTGIKDRMVMKSDSFADAMDRFLMWCGEDCRLYCWSESDVCQFRKESALKQYSRQEQLLKLTEGWEDVQGIFAQKSGISRIVKLGEAIDMCGISFLNHAHDALSDAMATAELYYELLSGKNIRLINQMLREGGGRPAARAWEICLQDYVWRAHEMRYRRKEEKGW